MNFSIDFIFSSFIRLFDMFLLESNKIYTFKLYIQVIVIGIIHCYEHNDSTRVVILKMHCQSTSYKIIIKEVNLEKSVTEKIVYG